MATCNACAGTGEDWTIGAYDENGPIDDCKKCNGTGESGSCPQFEHVPNRTGHCVICGYEVVTEVDDDGTPKLD